jgi:hypothetical protein
MAQVPDINKVQGAQSQGVQTNAAPGSGASVADQLQKDQISERLQNVKGQAGGGGVASANDSKLRALVEYLEGVLGVKAPEGDNYTKLQYLTSKLQERPPKEQVEILKLVDKQFPSTKSSPLKNTIKGLKQHVLAGLKDKARTDKGVASDLVNSKESLGQLNVDQHRSGLDIVAPDHKFINTQTDSIRGLAKKPYEKSLGFMLNFADHQQGFFEDSAFKFSEFAATSDKSKQAYLLVREADKFYQDERGFLQELKGAGRSRENNTELQAALRELFTLELQMGSRFDADFSNIEAGKKGGSDREDISSAISEKKSEIRTLHSNLT